MHRLLTAIVVPVALITAIAITASAADAGNGRQAVKTKVRIDKVTTPGADHTFVFKGRVTSKNDACLAKRGVEIFRDDQPMMRGDVPLGPIAVGRTRDNGKFALDTNTELLAITTYRAVVFERKHDGVKCKGAASKLFQVD